MSPSKVIRGGPTQSNPTCNQAGRGLAGKTVVKSTAFRHRKILRDNIQGITKPAIRRLARRGGVKRISATIYPEIRNALRQRLGQILKHCAIMVEYRQAKTVTVYDVIHSLRRLGTPVYGFDPDTYDGSRKPRREARFSDAVEY